MKYSSSGSRDAPIHCRKPVESMEHEGANPPLVVPDRRARRHEPRPVKVVPSPTKSSIRGQGMDDKSATLDDVMKMLSLLHKK
jgi:hypothetical protein